MKWCFLILFLVFVYLIFITLSRDHFSFVKYIGQWSPRFQTRYLRGKTLYDICQNKYESYLFLTKLGYSCSSFVFLWILTQSRF